MTHYDAIHFGPFCLSPSERLLTREGDPVDIGGRSFDLLAALLEQPGRVLSKRDLLKRVWADVVVEDGSLRFHMTGLRKLLGDGKDGARYIATQVGVGYAFVGTVEGEPGPAGSAPHTGSGTGLRTPRSLQPADEPPPAPSLPSRLDPLIGRAEDVTTLLKQIDMVPLVSIVGYAGVGKTTLAVEVGHRLAANFNEQIYFVDLAAIEDGALVASAIAAAIGISVQSDDPLAVLVGHIREQHLLLLLDNCEHVIEAAANIVEQIIDHAPGVRVIATSREPLRIRGEQVHRLGAHGYPQRIDGLGRDELLRFPAVELFCARARAGDSSLEIDDEAARLIAEMCGRLDGMALPIELAAVRVATHGVAATARLLGEKLSLGWPGRRTALPRQQTLRSTLDWSYDLLSDVEQVVLERLAVFVGPFSIDAALAVVADDGLGADEVASAIDELTAKSLIAADRERTAGAYRLLEMTRAYARSKLRAHEREGQNKVARRHASFFLAEIETVSAPQNDMLQDARGLQEQLGNLRSALEWCFGGDGDRRIGVRLAAASAQIFLDLSLLVECRSWCAKALEAIEEGQRNTALELELEAARGISLMFTRGNSVAAGEALDRALEIAIALEDRWAQLRLLGRLHIFHERIGEFSAAMAHAERAVDVATAIDEPEALGVAFSLSGISHHLAGDQNRARRDFSLALENSLPSRRDRTIRYGFDHRNRSAIGLSRALWLLGEVDEARRMADLAVADAARLDHPVTHCIALLWCFSLYLWMGEYDDAEPLIELFAERAEVNALGPYINAAPGLRGELAIWRGLPGRALADLEESLARLRAARYELLTTPFAISLARGLLLGGRIDEARALVDTTMAACLASGECFAVPELLRLKAAVARAAGEDGDALLDDAMALSREQGARAWELRAVIDRSAMLEKRGRRDQARNLLAASRGHFAPGGDGADIRRADDMLAALAA